MSDGRSLAYRPWLNTGAMLRERSVGRLPDHHRRGRRPLLKKASERAIFTNKLKTGDAALPPAQ